MITHTIRNNQFILGAEKEMFWPEKNTLIISDLHLGKGSHFSRNGAQIPVLSGQNNYWRISKILDSYEVKRVLILGDLFHSVYNKEWENFIDFLKNYSQINWVLIKGNHDILAPNEWKRAELEVYDTLEESQILFSHEPINISGNTYNLHGHVHPAVRLNGSALQSLRLPCFYFGEKSGILPAFGELTGMYTIRPKKGEAVFAIADGQVIKLS